MSYAGYLDRKRSKTYAISSGSSCISSPGTTGPTGVTGPAGMVIGRSEGNTGKTGYTGETGPTGLFSGLVASSIIPSTSDLDIGSVENPFKRGYFAGGIIGGLEVTDTSLIPTQDRIYDLGSTGARFGKIYAKEVVIDPTTIFILGSSGESMSMSFDTTTGQTNYSYIDASDVWLNL